MWNKLIYLLGIIIFCISCKTKKVSIPKTDLPSETVSVYKESIKSFELNNLDFHTFSGRAKTKIQLNQETHDVTLNVRVQRDQAIWISVTAILGVEVARVLITPDSVKILNKLQGEYIVKPFNYIYRYTSQGINFVALQDLLLANVSSNLLRTNNVQVASAEDEFIVVGLKDDLAYQYRINRENRPFNFSLQEVGGAQNLETYYQNFTKTDGYNFPQSMAFNITGDNILLKAQLAYNRVVFNENVDMPFSVSSRYKVIN